jgi:hypothetical protein
MAMQAAELVGRVLRTGGVAVAALATAAWAALGLDEAAGVAAGGAIALGNFRWLARDAGRLGAGGEGARRALPGTLRHLAAFGALAALLGSGWIHPLAACAGLAVLPPVLVAEGLRAAR